jgi:hypothetical protein
VTPEPYGLTDLEFAAPGARRALHGLAHQRPLRFAKRVVEVGTEVALAAVRDALARPVAAPLRRIEAGAVAAGPAAPVALYVHYSRTGAVSAMVRRQLAAYREAGFAVVFISMAGNIPAADWAAAGAACALLVQRHNAGLDFGAWHDLAPEVARRFPAAPELLLVNDSVLGPIRPLGPVFAALRAGGEGLFGLTESRQGGVHLQSYLLLARGPAAVADLLGFLGALRLSVSKWMIIRRGELRLSRHMAARGHRVAALFGYRRVLEAAFADAGERAYLYSFHRRIAADPALAAEQLWRWPLNPTHHLWRVLVRGFGYPFVKTELVRRNPGRLPAVADWPALLGGDSPAPAGELAEHLALLDAAAHEAVRLPG